MIVVDTNTIAYLYLPTEYTPDVETLLERDSGWLAPILWRSEFRSILSLYVRKEMITRDTALQMQAQAERQMADNEYSVTSSGVLKLALDSGCSAYDCEFVFLARSLDLPLVTHDRKLLQTFPGMTLTARELVRHRDSN